MNCSPMFIIIIIIIILIDLTTIKSFVTATLRVSIYQEVLLFVDALCLCAVNCKPC